MRFPHLLCALFLGSCMLHAQDARLIISTQVAPTRTRHMLVSFAAQPGTKVDKLVVKFPREVSVDAFQEGMLPQGWSLKARGHKIVLSGPLHPVPFHARLEMGRQDAPIQVQASVHGETGKLYDRENQILKLLPPLKVRDKLRGLLALPPLLCPGDSVEMRLAQPDITPADGTWHLNDLELRAVEDPAVTLPDGSRGLLLRTTIPDTLTGPLTMSYHDPLGLRTVHVTQDLKSRPGTLPATPPQGPRLKGCAVRGVVGGALCVTGWFPDAASRAGIQLDGKPAPPPVTASNVALFVPLPPDLTPGVHHITGNPAAGFPPGEPIAFEVIDVQAEMDREELVEGQVSELGFFVVGSTEPMKIRVINTTPDIITLDQGDEQVIETFGGGGNIATRTVETKALGNFVIKYELAEPRCPCLEP